MKNFEKLVSLTKLISFGIVSFINIGCTSFSGATLGTKSNHDSLAGIPYRMARPEFILTRTPSSAGSKTLSYSIEYSYEPDPTRIYMLQLDPTLFTDPEFTMNFGTGSTLSSTKTGFTDQIVPSISAVGSFLVNLAGAAAIIADKSENSLKNQISAEIDQSKDESCQQPSEIEHFITKTEETIAKELSKRIEQFKNDDVFSEQFHYINNNEQSCLEAVHSTFAEKDKAEVKEAKKKYIKAVDKYDKNPEHQEVMLNQIKNAVNNQDSDTLKEMFVNCRESEDTELIDRCNLIDTGREYLTSQIGSDPSNLLKKIVKLDGNSWRARHLLYLEREIDAIAIESLKYPQYRNRFDKAISILRAQRAQTIGASELYARAELISQFLKKIPTKSYTQGSRAPAVKDYTAARKELDETLKQIEDRRARLLSDVQPSQPPMAPPPPMHVPHILARDFTNKREFNRKPVDEKSPEFVIVLEEIPE